MSECILLGVDGGGTRTRAALMTGEGRVLGQGEAGPGNLRDVGPETLARNLAGAREAAYANASLDPAPAHAAHLGLAGVATEEDRGVVRAIGHHLQLAAPEHLEVGSDLRIALEGGLATRPGMVVIAGTGSVCYGRRADGLTARAGGLGPELDDPGSAHDLGRRALTAALRAADGRGPASELSGSLTRALGIQSLREVLGLLSAGELSRARMAALARTVTSAAAAGDAVARSIVAEGAAELASCAAAVWTRLSEPPCPEHPAQREVGFAPAESREIALAGSLAVEESYRPALEAALRQALPDCRPTPAELPPVIGAGLLAMQEVGLARDESVLSSLRRTAAPLPARD